MDKKAFSLVELLVWIMISMILMVWVWVLVSGWINNIVTQDKILENTADFREFSKNNLDLFSRINTRLEPKILSSTTALVKVWKNFDSLGVSFIWTQNLDSFYCSGIDVDSSITEHMEIKNFLPFEEIWEDIFNNFSQTLYWETSWFKSFYRSHIIKDSANNIIVWKFWVFWRSLDKYWTWTYLNNPTGLAYDNSKKLLFIADTGNNRILVYNNNSSSSDYKKIYKLLNEKDGLNQPMWLAFYDNVLYIANSWNWEILEYSSKNISNNPKLTLTWITKNWINKFEIEFLSGSIFLTNPDNLVDFSFSPNIKNNLDYFFLKDNKIKYFFISSLNSDSSQSDCIAWNQGKYVLNSSDNPIKCSSTEVWTWQLANLSTKNLNNQTIEISDIKPSFTDNKSYYIKLNLYKDNNLKYEKYFPYFVNWDEDLTTREDNTLNLISNDFKYPTWIKYDSWKLKINDFWDRAEYSINLNLAWKTNTRNLANFEFSKIPFYENRDFRLYTPISKLIIDYNNQFLSLKLDYFKQYNCYNLDQKVIRSFVLGKNFK
jgi:hypothetical protein